MTTSPLLTITREDDGQLRVAISRNPDDLDALRELAEENEAVAKLLLDAVHAALVERDDLSGEGDAS
jgi:hypothetical protein